MGRKSKLSREAILLAIRNWDKTQIPLTFERLAAMFATSKTNLHYHLRCLRQEGLVDWVDHTPGTIRAIAQAGQGMSHPVPGDNGPAPAQQGAMSGNLPLIHIPLLAEITAGEPGDAPGANGVSYHADWVTLPLHALNPPSPHHLFALKVRGDSMKDAGIHNGDVVIIQPDCCPRKGDTVAARIGRRVTLKTYRAEADGSVTLIPANPDYHPRTYPPGRVDIQGKVIFVICPVTASNPQYAPLSD